jgi:hypothetical protein
MVIRIAATGAGGIVVVIDVTGANITCKPGNRSNTEEGERGAVAMLTLSIFLSPLPLGEGPARGRERGSSPTVREGVTTLFSSRHFDPLNHTK